jgi:hypothetical protein
VLPETVLVTVLDGVMSAAAELANLCNHTFCPLSLWDKINLTVRMKNLK